MGPKKLFLKKLYQTASTERIFNYWRSLFLEEFLFMLMPVLTSDLTMSNFVHSHMGHKRSSDNFFSCSATLKPATFQQVFSRIKTNTPVFLHYWITTISTSKRKICLKLIHLIHDWAMSIRMSLVFGLIRTRRQYPHFNYAFHEFNHLQNFRLQYILLQRPQSELLNPLFKTYQTSRATTQILKYLQIYTGVGNWHSHCKVNEDPWSETS